MAVLRRAAHSGDEPLLRRLLWLAVHWDADPAPAPPGTAFPRELGRYVEGFGRPGDLGSVAECERGSPLGAAWLRLFAAAEPGYGWVSEEIPELSIAVLPEHRGGVVGSELLSELLSEADARSLPGVSLSVARANPAARLYARAGFVVVEEVGQSWTMLRRSEAASSRLGRPRGDG